MASQSTLTTQLNVQSPCIVTALSGAVHNARDRLRFSPLIALESFKIIDPKGFLLQSSVGLFSHLFVIATIRVEKEGHTDGILTYIRVDFDSEPFEGHDVAQVASLSDDHEILRNGARGLGRLASTESSAHSGPSLDAFASLLEIVYSQTPRYDVFSRNCLWLTETLLLSTARRYSEHWVANYICPDALRQYVAGEIDAVTCVTTLSIDNPVARWFGATSTGVLRATQSFFTCMGPDHIKPHDEEIHGLVKAWISKD